MIDAPVSGGRLSALCLVLNLAAASLLGAWDYRGVCYDANWEDRSEWYGTGRAEAALKRLPALGVNAVSLTPFAYQTDVSRPEIRFREELDPGMEQDTRVARQLGLRVVLKPHIWSHEFWDGSQQWPGSIEMKTEEDWGRWFQNYERMIRVFAAHAARLRADMFVVGVEYARATKGHDKEWRHVIASVREIYKGPVTYAAHGMEEATAITFWDALDLIGVNAYFPLSESMAPAPEELQSAWRRHAAELSDLARRHGGKRILLTEVGYPSVDGASRRPYMWAPRGSVVDEREQADCYDAMMTVLKDAQWLAGVFLWKFKIAVTPAAASREPSEYYFAFQDKPAEVVIKRHFLGR